MKKEIKDMAYLQVVNVYFNETPDREAHPSATGLVIELADGRFFRHQSTDPVMPFEEMPRGLI